MGAVYFWGTHLFSKRAAPSYSNFMQTEGAKNPSLRGSFFLQMFVLISKRKINIYIIRIWNMKIKLTLLDQLNPQ